MSEYIHMFHDTKKEVLLYLRFSA